MSMRLAGLSGLGPRLGWCLLSLAGLMLVARADESSDCLVCHSSTNLAERGPDGKARSLYVDPKRYFATAHGKQSCLTCHGNLGMGPHGDAMGRLPAVDPACAPYVAGLPRARAIALSNCMKCHSKQFDDYRQSVHGQQALKGGKDVPRCDDCHGMHDVTGSQDIESSVSAAHVPATCAKCHSNALVMAQHKINPNVVETFESHFHGRKRELGDARAAVCTSCHAPLGHAHSILRPEDPKSTVNPRNHADGCGRTGCHPGTSEAFATSFSHSVPTNAVRPAVFYVHKFHSFMMLLVLGTMCIHIVLDILRRQINKYRAQHGGQA